MYILKILRHLYRFQSYSPFRPITKNWIAWEWESEQSATHSALTCGSCSRFFSLSLSQIPCSAKASTYFIRKCSSSNVFASLFLCAGILHPCMSYTRKLGISVFHVHRMYSQFTIFYLDMQFWERKNSTKYAYFIFLHTHTHKDTDISSHTPITITRIYNEIKEIEIQQPNLLAYAMASILQWILLFSLLCVVCCIYLWESAKKQKKLCMDISRHCKHGIT